MPSPSPLSFTLLLAMLAASCGSNAPPPFVADGLVGDFLSAPGDARAVQSLVGSVEDGGRIVVGFSRSDGYPAARVGHLRVEFLRDLRVVRIWLPPEVHTSAVTDLGFPPRPLRGAYVVRALKDGTRLFVDLHLGVAVLVRASVRSDPALVVVEFQPGGSPLPAENFYRGPSDGIVLLEPVESNVSYPLEVSGYARTYEGHVAAKLCRGDTVLAETFTTAGGGIEVWGEFRMRFESGPEGELRLLVSGGEDPNDEAERPREPGLEIPLELRAGASGPPRPAKR